MADGTKIEWTDATWNPITGCAVVSPGCTNCYAMKLAGTRLKHHPSRKGLTKDTKAGPVWTGEMRFNRQWLDQPLRWTKPRMIFVCAHGDLFAEGVPDEWIDQVFAVMALTPQHTFQVLTKRPERMRDYLTRSLMSHRLMAAQLQLPFPIPSPGRWPHMPLPNVWLGVSVEDQRRADERIPILLDTPAAVRWISAEPLLGLVDIGRWVATAEVTCKQCKHSFWLHNADPCEHKDGGGWTLACPRCGNCRCKPGWTEADSRTIDMEPPADWIDREVGRFTKVHPTIPVKSGLDWVVAGGESGPDARPMHPDWARSLRDQCAAAGVPFLFKQWGEWGMPTDSLGALDWPYHPDAGRTHWFDRNTCIRPIEDGWDDKYHSGKCRALDPKVELFKTPEYLDQVTRCPQASCRSAGKCCGNEGRSAVTWVGKKTAGRLLDGIEHNSFPEVRR